MAIADTYVTSSEYRLRAELPDPGNDEVLDDDLLAVSRYIERRLGRFFNLDASAVARVFTLGGRYATLVERNAVVFLPDFGAVPTSILIDKDNDGLFTDETALATTDYELHPENATLGPEAQPYDSIKLTPWGNENAWPVGSRVEITAQWGWPAVPEGIKRYVTDLTQVLRLQTPRATSRIDDGIGEISTIPPFAQAIIHKLGEAYMRREFI